MYCKLKSPVKVEKINKIEVLTDDVGNQTAINRTEYRCIFTNGFYIELDEDNFKSMFSLI
ncbi:hypothetical protein EXN37_00970 [Clostridium botulinum]|nr:hypothetical protein [Clostridium botulinum]